MDTMFNTMLQLPLFQGLVHDDFTSILEKVKLGFVKHEAGEVIAVAGSTCDRLIFVMNGKVAVCTPFLGMRCHFTEFLQAPAPFVIEPQSLFGMNTSFVATYTARSEVKTLNVNKAAVVNELFRYDIFRLNYTNMVCNRMQSLRNRLWTIKQGTTEQRIANFILNHSERPAGKKIVKIKMEELAQELNETRISISRVLNQMKKAGLIELHRGEITVHEASQL